LNREQINKRIQDINGEMATLRASHSKLEGHLAEAIHWLSQLDKPEENPSDEVKEVTSKEEPHTENPYPTNMYVE